jgi:hypothetical protein
LEPQVWGAQGKSGRDLISTWWVVLIVTVTVALAMFEGIAALVTPIVAVALLAVLVMAGRKLARAC